jgi:hypothetical protein
MIYKTITITRRSAGVPTASPVVIFDIDMMAKGIKAINNSISIILSTIDTWYSETNAISRLLQ